MLEGLEDEELERYLDENPWIMPILEIDVGGTMETYASVVDTATRDEEPSEEVIAELPRAHDTFEHEMELLLRVTTTTVEEINVGTAEIPRALSIAKDLPPIERATMIKLLHEYKDVFVWSHEDMRGLDCKFYQHQINLATDAKPVQQRQYRMNLNYTTCVKEEIDKILKIGFIRLVKRATWLSLIIIVPKKNGKIRYALTTES